MPGLKKQTSVDLIEKDFLDALQRLKDGTPRNKALKAKKAEGSLRITVQNVALEAGRSRTLIALEDCRYPRVRELIKHAKDGREGPMTTHSELVQRLRADKAMLNLQLSKYKAEATAHYLARVAAEKDAARERAAASRARRGISAQRRVVNLTSVNSGELPEQENNDVSD